MNEPTLIIGAPYLWDDFFLESDLLVKTFCQAFSTTDPVFLRILIIDRPITPENERLLKVQLIKTLKREFFFLSPTPAISAHFIIPEQILTKASIFLRTNTMRLIAADAAIPIIELSCNSLLTTLSPLLPRTQRETDFLTTIINDSTSTFKDTTSALFDTFKKQSGMPRFPLYNQLMNQRITQNPSKDKFDFFASYIDALPQKERFLSIGCGPGRNERSILEKISPPKEFFGFDLSPQVIAAAQSLARNDGYNFLHYFKQDVHNIYLKEQHYDMVMAFTCLHHFHNLERIFFEVNRSLTPEGIFIVYEYCGPARMQFGKQQEKIIHDMVRALPIEWRKINNKPDRIKAGYITPSREQMIAIDYSEGIRSDAIEPLLNEYFTVIDTRPAGGTLLNHVFNGIENCLDETDPQQVSYINELIIMEDRLLKEGSIQSDAKCFVCKKR